MKLSYFPQIKVVHTSELFHGQVYVPMLNWLMMVGTVLVAAIYNNTTSLGNAYGVCVIFVTFFDTCMVTLAALIVWRFHPLVVLFPFLVFACLDGTFLSSALTKVPDGAWFTLTLAAVLAAMFILWRFGKENQWAAEAADRFSLSTLLSKSSDGLMKLTDRFGGGDLSPIRGFGIFFDKTGEKTPHVFTQFLSKLVAVPECVVFFHLRSLETPSVPIEDRFAVSRLGIPGGYRLVVRHGFMDEVITPNLASLIFEQIRDFVIRHSTNAPGAEQQEGQNEKSQASVLEGVDSSSASSEYSGNPVANDNTAIDDPQTTANPQATDTSMPSSARPSHVSHAPSNPTTPLPSSTAKPDLGPLEHGHEHLDAQTTAELRRLEHAFSTQSLYIIGKESLRVKEGTGFARMLALKFYLFLRENTRTKIANLHVPVEKVVEVGFVKEM